MITRLLKERINEYLRPNKVVGLFGARRTGKTFLMNEIINDLPKDKVLSVSGDDLNVANVLSSQRLSELQRYVQNKEYLFIDEAQLIPNIGLSLKLLTDHSENLKIFITGSSVIDLKNKTGEPLVGRSFYFNLYPIAQAELKEDYPTSKNHLPERLIYGSYPEIILANTVDEKRFLLEQVMNGYLLKDILILDNIKNSVFIFNLLKLIAFQVGNDVSYTELANSLKVGHKTVMRYLELLEKCYIIFSLHGFSRNLRKEITKSPRYYFWDNGIRNAIISNFNTLSDRDDIGKLWENYCMVERMKFHSYRGWYGHYYFWRTYDQKEIDLIEDIDGRLYGFEFKWSSSKYKLPKEFLEVYKESSVEVINQDNYLYFITPIS